MLTPPIAVFLLSLVSSTVLGAPTVFVETTSSTLQPCIAGGGNIERAMHALLEADAVCIDVDSTTIQSEGIDELADYMGVGQEVAKITSSAMNGFYDLREAFRVRLDIIRPSLADIDRFLVARPLKLAVGIDQLVSLLTSRGVDVYLISGGFHELMDPVARKLGFPDDRVYANRFLFDVHGNYNAFDTSAPTSKTGGKAIVIEQLKKRKNYKTVVMIGDGASDAQARPPADVFIGYGGVVSRPSVRRVADWFVCSHQTLIDALKTEKRQL